MGSSPAKRATNFPIPNPSIQVHATLYRGGLAQLVRASVLHTEGQRFKSSIPHHSSYRRARTVYLERFQK